MCQSHVGLRQHLGHVRHDRPEEGPVLVVVTQLGEATLVLAHPLLHGTAHPVPAGEHHAALRPRQHPRNGPQIGDRRRLLTRGGSTADVERTDLGQRCRRGEVLDEAGSLVDQGAVGAASEFGELVEVRIGLFRVVSQPLGVQEGGLDCRGEERLEIAAGTDGFGILGGDDLALFGESKRPLHRARRLRQNRVVAGSAAAADGAASTVEQLQPHPCLACSDDEIEFGSIQGPVGGQVPAVLVGVRVSEHHLLRVALSPHQLPVEVEIEGRRQRRRAVAQILDRLEQRNHAHAARRSVVSAAGAVQPRLLQQEQRLQHVRHRRAHADDVVRHRLRTEPIDGASRRVHHSELLDREFAQLGVG